MARRTRTLYIAYLLTHEYPISPSIQIPAPHQIFLNFLESQTFSLFPFLSPSFGSLQELHETYTSQSLDSVGISITCGTRQYYTTYHLILSLRRVFNISTPIQIFYAGDKDLHPHLAQKLSSVPNVETIDLTTLFPNEMKELDGWSLKPFAALASRFRTVIYMDADVLFFESPLRILDSPKFKETGQFYYHDRRNREERFIPGTKWFRSLLSSPSESAKDLGYLTEKTSHEMDSGFFVLDKSRAGILFSLLLACKMNSKVERGVLYSMTYGDKESFWFANEVLRVPFAFNRHFGSVIGMSDSALSTDTYPVVCGVWLLQLDESGKPFWWNGGGVLKDREAKRGFEYLEFERMAFDLDGEKTHWLPGHCLNTTTGLVRELNMKERGVMETYKNVYQTFVDRVDLLDI
ncbi:hypothetical protein HDU79_010484 [Rhizoclosmatium sp. JEL0117]|nr:hypothetical protein HDU79_010484 [Rhizoclosmatium sp. JEL0117]